MEHASEPRQADPSDASGTAPRSRRSVGPLHSGIAPSGGMDQLVDVLERAVARRINRAEDRFRRES